MPRPVVALLTDFGLDDPFVGIMKGVILTRCPDAAIVDLTHGVPPQGVAEGAFWLDRSVEWLPPGAIVVAVVDPGVGTVRRPVLLTAVGRVFVGPDNGLFSPVLERDPASVAFSIDVDRLALSVRSRTFHGRDVFAPVAGEIAAGRILPADVGPLLRDLVPSTLPRATSRDGGTFGIVIAVDRFGNLITNIDRALIPEGAVAEVGGARAALRGTYGEVAPGDLVALVNAFDVLEIAERDGSAARLLGVGRGAEVVIRSVDPVQG